MCCHETWGVPYNGRRVICYDCGFSRNDQALRAAGAKIWEAHRNLWPEPTGYKEHDLSVLKTFTEYLINRFHDP